MDKTNQLQKASNMLMNSLQPMQQNGVLTLQRKDFNTFRSSVPSRVEDTVDTIPVCVLEKMVLPSTIKQYLESEILRTSVQMNVSNNLRPDQVAFCADTLLEMFPVNSLEDFTICLKRMAQGVYGTTYHQLDSAVIVAAFQKYIEEKTVYIEREAQSTDTDPIPDVDYEAFKQRRAAMQIKEAEEKQAEFNRKKMEANKELEYMKVRSGYTPDEEKGIEILLRQEWRKECFDPISAKPTANWTDFEEWVKKH